MCEFIYLMKLLPSVLRSSLRRDPDERNHGCTLQKQYETGWYPHNIFLNIANGRKTHRFEYSWGASFQVVPSIYIENSRRDWKQADKGIMFSNLLLVLIKYIPEIILRRNCSCVLCEKLYLWACKKNLKNDIKYFTHKIIIQQKYCNIVNPKVNWKMKIKVSYTIVHWPAKNWPTSLFSQKVSRNTNI